MIGSATNSDFFPEVNWDSFVQNSKLNHKEVIAQAENPKMQKAQKNWSQTRNVEFG